MQKAPGHIPPLSVSQELKSHGRLAQTPARLLAPKRGDRPGETLVVLG